MSKQLFTYQRTTALLKQFPYHYDKVEQWISRGNYASGFRRDFGNFADVLAWLRTPQPSNALTDLWGTLAIQTCTKQTLSEHINKVRRDPQIRDRLASWLQSNRFEIWAWKRHLPKGRVRSTYIPSFVRFESTPSDPLSYQLGETELTRFGFTVPE